MKCESCGAEISSNSKFCPECGSKLTGTIPKQTTISADTVTEVFHENDFDNICHILDKNLPEYIKITLADTYLGKLNNILTHESVSLEHIDDDMINMLRLKDNMLEYIKECAKFNFIFYNNFINYSGTGDNRQYLISREYMEKFVNAFILSNGQLLKEIEYDLPQFLNHLQQIKGLIKNNESKKNQTKKKTGMMLGVAGLATLATGGLAAPLMAAAGLGTSVFMDHSSIEDMESRISDNLGQCKSKFNNIMSNYNKILETVYLNQKNNLNKELKKALAITFNKIISQQQCDPLNLNKYIKSIEQVLINNIKQSNYCISEINANASYIDQAMADEKNSSLLECLPEDRQQQLLDELANRTEVLFKYLDNSAWWLFKFNQQIDFEEIKIPSVEHIFEKYQLTDKYETLYLMCNSSFYCKGSGQNFNANKFVEFGKNFNSFPTDKVLIYYDDTFFGKGDDGFAITDTQFYARKGEKSININLDKINNLTLNDEKISFFANNNLIWSASISSIETKYHIFLINCFKKLILTKNETRNPNNELNKIIHICPANG